MEQKKIVPNEVETLTYETNYSEAVKPIDEIIASLVAMKENGATHLRLEANSDRDGFVWDISLSGLNYREETDEEYNKRIASRPYRGGISYLSSINPLVQELQEHIIADFRKR